MRKETVILKIVFILAIMLGAASMYVQHGPQKTRHSVIAPFSESLSIFNLFKLEKAPQKTIYGYLPYWKLETAAGLQLDKLTDVAYFGLNIDRNGDFSQVGYDGYQDPGYRNWKNSKELDKLIKDAKKHDVSVALTVISHNDEISDTFLDCRTCWDTLATNIEQELDFRKIKDVNLNFEYTTYTPKEKALQYTAFVDFLNKKLDKKYGDSKVVVSSFADSIVKDRVTEIEGLSKVADAIFIMAYDFHRPTSDNAGPVAPIGGKGVYAEYDIETMLADYIQISNPQKLILGVPYYGYNWVVTAPEQYAARIEGNDVLGYSQSQTYANVMDTIAEVKPEVLWDSLAKTPYFTYISPETGATRAVYFENTESLKEKYALAKAKNLMGVGIWALGYDGEHDELWDLLVSEFMGKM
ncbi:hypothetical protein KAZ57_00865 [Patescibacteria group bacterium]|nr:hypothetical protein [Patescibacteria group bacterium]